MNTSASAAAPPSEPPRETSPGSTAAPTHHAWAGLSWAGLVGALIGFGLALTPSLLPRPALYMGLVAGLAAIVGYGVGVLIAWALRRAHVPSPSPLVRRRSWQGLAVAGPVIVVAVLILGVQWQEQVRELVGEEPVGISAWQVPVVAVVVAALVLLISRGIRGVFRLLRKQLRRILPPWVAAAISVVVVVFAVWWIASGVLGRGFVSFMDTVYAEVNAGTPEGVTPVTSPLRSGSPESLVPWSTLGSTGREFVAGGPDAAQAVRFTDTEPLEPIRVYVGLESAPDAQARAELAVAELERAGAFDREVLIVAGATGTGWLEPPAVAAVEYIWGGDTAIVTSQYSYLPSWISFLVDQDRARAEGRALFDAVAAAWADRPEGERPQLIAYGLSLGSFAIQSAFATSGGIVDRTDGAVLVGTPNFAEPWSTITANRDDGSPEWEPVVANGESIRFAPDAPGFAEPSGAWERPRVAYLQHANDPVVWWSTDLIWSRPDWLAEPPGPGVSPRMRWIPVVTFLQVTVDQFFGVTVPDGQGHNYAGAMPGTWAEVTQPPSWTSEQSAELSDLLLGQD